MNEGNQLPSFRKEGCPTGGVVGKAWFDLFTPLLPEGGVPNGRGGRKSMVRPILLYNIRIGVAKAAYLSYHLPLRGLLLPEGGELSYHSSFKRGFAPTNYHLPTHFPDEPNLERFVLETQSGGFVD